jgi:hypothetical protein
MHCRVNVFNYYPDNDAGTCLPSRCLAMDARSDTDIPAFRRYATLLSTNLRICLPSGFFSSGFLTNILYALLLVLHALPISSQILNKNSFNLYQIWGSLSGDYEQFYFQGCNSCILVEIYRHVKGYATPMFRIEEWTKQVGNKYGSSSKLRSAVGSPETSIHIYSITRRHIAEDSSTPYLIQTTSQWLIAWTASRFA